MDGMDGNGTGQAEQLEREIDQTRKNLDHTFEELEERLTLDHLVSEARQRFTAAAQSVVAVAKQYPLGTAALAAVGGGALILHRRRATRSRALVNGDSLADIVRALAARVSEASPRVSEAAQDASVNIRHRAGELIEGVDDGIGELARRARANGQAAERQIGEFARSQPLPFGLLALALGAVMGLALCRGK